MTENSNRTYQKRINKVVQHLNDNLDKAIPLKDLAQVAYFSPFHFHRIFVAVTGESVHFMTNRLRLEKAAKLIRYSEKSLSSISMDCGFSSPATFSRAFKQYFELSPSQYRKGQEIENSKICKELFPMKEYLVPMSNEELQNNFPVEILNLPKRRVAYIRVNDSYREGVVIEAFRQMVLWAKKKQLYTHQTIFGMSLDDPMVTPKEKVRYEVCLTLPTDYEMEESSEMEAMIMEPCKYAMTTVVGDIRKVATATHYLFNSWLINSEYEPEHSYGLEIFLDKEKILDWSQFQLQLCIPIKKLSQA